MTKLLSADEVVKGSADVGDGLLSHLGQIAGQFSALFDGVDPAAVSGADARVVVERLTRLEQMVAARRALFAGRVAQAGSWREDGSRSAADWLARRAGTSQSRAARELETAKRVTDGPAPVRSAYTSGKLSSEAASEVSAATSVAPESAEDLLARAGREDLSALRRQCRQARDGALKAEQQNARMVRLHRERYLRTWTDRDGAGRIDGRLAPDAYAGFLAALAPFQREIFNEARRQGRRERSDAYSADALLSMAQAAGAAPSPAEPAGAAPDLADPAGDSPYPVASAGAGTGAGAPEPPNHSPRSTNTAGPAGPAGDSFRPVTLSGAGAGANPDPAKPSAVVTTDSDPPDKSPCRRSRELPSPSHRRR